MAMDDVVRSMVRDTEFEIMAEALGVETTDLPNAPSDGMARASIQKRSLRRTCTAIPTAARIALCNTKRI
jgi:hypothetical protein